MPVALPDGLLLRANGAVYIMVSGERQRISDPEILGELDGDTGTAKSAGAAPPALLTLSEEQLDAIPEGPDFAAERAVVEATREDEVRSNMPRRYMWTHATVSQESGIVAATTRCWTRQPWVGFTGGVLILLGDQNEEVIGYTNLVQIGVDGFRIPFKLSDRTVPWQQNLSPEVTRRTQRLEIVHSHAPRGRLIEILQEMKAVAETIGSIATALRAIAGSS
jgi:hypothetical protein